MEGYGGDKHGMKGDSFCLRCTVLWCAEECLTLRFFAIRAFPGTSKLIHNRSRTTHALVFTTQGTINSPSISQNEGGELRIECGAAVKDLCTFCHLRPIGLGKEEGLCRDRRKEAERFCFGFGGWRDREWQCRSF